LLPALLLAVAVSATPAAGETSNVQAPSADAANGRILFTHCERHVGCQIYTANPDGSAIEQVTSAGDAFQGDWSPDGSRIAYVSFTSGDAAIWLVNADGSDPQQLTPDDPDSDNFWPRFTADGAWILFTNCFGDECDGGISAIRPDGTGMHAITPNAHFSYNAAEMSPDGSRLAYMRWHEDGVKMAVYVSSATGTDEQRVSPPALQGWGPVWSPSGDRIAFASEVFMDRPAPSLYTVAPDGSDVEALTDPPRPHSDMWPDYSPDGTKILFESDRRYGDFCCNDIFIVAASGGRAHRVHLPFDAYDARWGTAPLESGGTGSSLRSPGTLALGGPPCAYLTLPGTIGRCS
jgi:TolB protein